MKVENVAYNSTGAVVLVQIDEKMVTGKLGLAVMWSGINCILASRMIKIYVSIYFRIFWLAASWLCLIIENKYWCQSSWHFSSQSQIPVFHLSMYSNRAHYGCNFVGANGYWLWISITFMDCGLSFCETWGFQQVKYNKVRRMYSPDLFRWNWWFCFLLPVRQKDQW